MTCCLRPGARAWSVPWVTQSARAFHQSLPGYAPTPLIETPTLARELGVGRVLVKDESRRMGLGAFKILGASWAAHRLLDASPGVELVAAAKGNHGYAVSWIAAHYGVGATIFIPAPPPVGLARRIVSHGAQVVGVDGDYDAAVEAATRYAQGAPDRALVQDLARPGYEEVPTRIVEGYRTLLEEIDEQLEGGFDLIAVPVGVGSLAEAVVRHYRSPENAHPSVLCVEPTGAACLLRSLRADRPVTVATRETVLTGLNCGSVSTSAWQVLRAGCDNAVAIGDEVALRAAADLASLGIASGPSGAASLAGVRAIVHPARSQQQHQAELARPGGLGDDSVVVLLNTEGSRDWE